MRKYAVAVICLLLSAVLLALFQIESERGVIDSAHHEGELAEANGVMAPAIEQEAVVPQNASERAEVAVDPPKQLLSEEQKAEIRLSRLRELLSTPKWKRNLADTIVAKGLSVALSSDLYLPLIKEHADEKIDPNALKEKIESLLPELAPAIDKTTELRSTRRSAIDSVVDQRIKSGLAVVSEVGSEAGQGQGLNKDPNRVGVSTIRNGRCYTVSIGDGDDAALDSANRELEASVDQLVMLVRSRLRQGKH